ncbi:MAG TPA: hypothetical protein VNR39_13580 [Pseudolabrys sp.]|nr:hypothetical protein [Pseudolabrys sp.]
MQIAKRLQRQADTCAQLAAATHDEESRERYLRLEQLYRDMLIGDRDGDTRFAGVLNSEVPTQRLS